MLDLMRDGGGHFHYNCGIINKKDRVRIHPMQVHVLCKGITNGGMPRLLLEKTRLGGNESGKMMMLITRGLADPRASTNHVAPP
jgi:hypothetical protein